MRHSIDSKAILLLTGVLVVAGGCGTVMPEDRTITRGPEKTASTMTQSPSDYQPAGSARRADNRRRRSSTAERYPAAGTTTTARGEVIQGRPLTRSERAINVLRRSPLGALGRWATGRNRNLGPSNPGPADITDTTPREIGTTPQMNTSSGGTTVPPGPSSNPGAGRVIVGNPVDTGSGIRSTVTGTPVEPIWGNTPVPTNAQTLNANTSGSASAASSPPASAAGATGTPPLTAIAPGEPAPGTTVTNATGSDATKETTTKKKSTKKTTRKRSP